LPDEVFVKGIIKGSVKVPSGHIAAEGKIVPEALVVLNIIGIANINLR